MSRHHEESLEPFVVLSAEKLKVSEENISIRERVFFPKKPPSGKISYFGCREHQADIRTQMDNVSVATRSCWRMGGAEGSFQSRSNDNSWTSFLLLYNSQHLQVAPSLYAAKEKCQFRAPFASGENNPTTLLWYMYICNDAPWKTGVCHGISLATLKVSGVLYLP